MYLIKVSLPNEAIDLCPRLSIEGAAPAAPEALTHKLFVGGDPVPMDHLGPLVVGEDGRLSRITNWADMYEVERQVTLRVLTKRNVSRLKALREKL